MTEIASDTYMTVLYQLGRKWKKRTDFWRYFDILGEILGRLRSPGRQMCAVHCRMAAKTPYPAYKHKPGVAMCGRATNVCRALPDGGENALSGLQTQTRRRDVRPGDKFAPYIAGWRRKHLIRPTNTNPASRCAAGRQICVIQCSPAK